MPGRDISESYGSCLFSLVKNLLTVLHAGCSNLHSHQEGSLCSTHFPAFITSTFFDNGHLDWCELVSHYSFDFHFSNN